jgi:hypothetical protein
MAWLGRFQLGDFVGLIVQCKDQNGVPTMPDNVPISRFFDPNGTFIGITHLPTLERFATPGLFQLTLPISSIFSTQGNWRVISTYSIGSFTGIDENTFEVVPGGEARGNVISMYYYRRPDADYIVFQTDNGDGIVDSISAGGLILAGRSPRI